jgi:hypothetical protein
VHQAADNDDRPVVIREAPIMIVPRVVLASGVTKVLKATFAHSALLDSPTSKYSY